MAYRVKTDVFEGPFDLLLQLVSKKKVDVTAVSISEIADKYLEYVEEMQDLDLDVASDFLVVASTLLEMKAASILPDETKYIGDEFDDLTPEDTSQILLARLLTYKQIKNASQFLSQREDHEMLLHPRHTGPDPEFVGLLPDFLKDVTPFMLAVLCAEFAMRKEVVLLESKHIAAIPMSVDETAEKLTQKLYELRRQTFTQLLEGKTTPEAVVVTFLAILELLKSNIISIKQEEPFSEIDIHFIDRTDVIEK